MDMLNAVKSVLADVSSVSPSSEQRGHYWLGESLCRVRLHPIVTSSLVTSSLVTSISVF